MNRLTATIAVFLLPAFWAGSLLGADATINDVYNAITVQIQKNDVFHEQVIFLLQSLAIPVGFILGFHIFKIWLAGRQSRMP